MVTFRRNHFLDQKSTFCTLHPLKDHCTGDPSLTLKKSPGDSGGPVVMKRGPEYVLAGVVSWGSNICAEPGHQDVSNDIFSGV